MNSSQAARKRELWPLLEQLAALKNGKFKKPLTHSEIALFGDPFTRTDFSDFWTRSQYFLGIKPQKKNKTYKRTLLIDAATAHYIEKALNNNDWMGEDDTICETVRFPHNKYEMDIKCCGADEDVAWTEAVLFDEQGRQISYSEPSDEYFGEWELEDDDGNIYIVTVIKTDDD